MGRLTYRSPVLHNAVSYGACEGVECCRDCENCKIGAIISKLCAYEDTGLEPGDIENWIYRSVNSPDSEFEKTIRAVENALGFKLFVWQKAYIENGHFRQMGATTAEILRDLLDVSAEPIDYTKGVVNQRQQFYRRELREIKAKLDGAGIPTRAVFFSQRDKWEYTHKGEAEKNEQV